MLSLKRERFEPLDLDALRRDHSCASVAAGAGVTLKRAGPGGRELLGLCPIHSEKTPSFSVFDGGRRWHCFGCGRGGDVLDLVQAIYGIGLRDAGEMLGGGEMPVVTLPPMPSADSVGRVEDARAIWSASVPIGGTLAETYLRNRAITIPLPDCLRFASIPCGARGPVFPALVAAISDKAGELVGIQRTFLAADGIGKASVAKPKLSLGRVSGGAVRLAPESASLIVCEGIEDALSLIQSSGRAAWATCGTSNLGRVDLPDVVADIVIGADGDDAGGKARRNVPPRHMPNAACGFGLSARCRASKTSIKNRRKEQPHECSVRKCAHRKRARLHDLGRARHVGYQRRSPVAGCHACRPVRPGLALAATCCGRNGHRCRLRGNRLPRSLRQPHRRQAPGSAL